MPPTVTLGAFETLFELGPPHDFLVTPHPFDISRVDGRFLLLRPERVSAPRWIQIAVVPNWTDDFRGFMRRGTE
jgi:hypothetical protein